MTDDLETNLVNGFYALRNGVRSIRDGVRSIYDDYRSYNQLAAQQHLEQFTVSQDFRAETEALTLHHIILPMVEGQRKDRVGSIDASIRADGIDVTVSNGDETALLYQARSDIENNKGKAPDRAHTLVDDFSGMPPVKFDSEMQFAGSKGSIKSIVTIDSGDTSQLNSKISLDKETLTISGIDSNIQNVNAAPEASPRKYSATRSDDFSKWNGVIETNLGNRGDADNATLRCDVKRDGYSTSIHCRIQ